VGLFNALEADETIVDTPPAAPPALEVTVGPRFDFYTVLPNQELDLNPDIEPAELQSGNANSAQYLLQVGSFRQQTDADRRRGELALLGLEATVEPGDGDNGRWYRVYLGPFESRSEMARARSLTAQADMDTLLLKRESP
jgi:cell division protein FtsN